MTVRTEALDGLFVVETEHNRYVGSVEPKPDGTIVVRSGMRGHPAVVTAAELVEVTPVAEHPDVIEVVLL